MLYRDATIADAEAISALVTALAAAHIAPSLSSAGSAKLLASMDCESTSERFKNGWLHILATTGNDIEGVVVVKPATHLYHLFVATDRQRSGIGHSLFRIADERVTEDEGREISTVNASLNAIEFYVRLGFSVKEPIVDHEGVRFQPMTRTVRRTD